MTDCISCKYHVVINGVERCVMNRTMFRCSFYERDWGFTVFYYLFLIVMTVMTLVITFFIALFLGVIK